MSSYYSPSSYGINDVVVPDGGSSFRARIYYPSEAMEVQDVPILEGTYPLVAFAHGDRSSRRDLCPADRTEDYKRWGAVLHLLARCGFVVVSPAVHDVIGDSEKTAIRLEQTIVWARTEWAHRDVLFHPPVKYFDPDVVLASAPGVGKDARPEVGRRIGRGVLRDNTAPLGPPTNLGVVGHSWGARAAARVAVRGTVQVTAIGSVAGSWDDNASLDAIVAAGKPTLMMAGTDDSLNASSLQGLWSRLAIPKHQALLQKIGHWDWFDQPGSIHPCDPAKPRPACPVGWQTCSELVLGFMTKYLLNHWWRPPYLLGSPGGRPPLMQWYEEGAACALKVRWDDPTASASQGQVGDVTLGGWTVANPW